MFSLSLYPLFSCRLWRIPHHFNSPGEFCRRVQASDNGNVTISILSFTPTREDNGKVLICRAINEVMKHSIKETTLKLNIYCEYIHNIYDMLFSFIGATAKLRLQYTQHIHTNRLGRPWLRSRHRHTMVVCGRWSVFMKCWLNKIDGIKRGQIMYSTNALLLSLGPLVWLVGLAKKNGRKCAPHVFVIIVSINFLVVRRELLVGEWEAN